MKTSKILTLTFIFIFNGIISVLAQENLPVILLTQFDSISGNYIDQQVIVNGKIDHVCKHIGQKFELVSDDGNSFLEIEGKQKFLDTIVGKNVSVIGIVREFKVDEAYCKKMEDVANKMTDEKQKNDNLAQIDEYRKEMKAKKTDHLSFYWLEFVKFK